MQPQQVIRVESHENTSLTFIKGFWKEALGEHLLPDSSVHLSENEIAFSGSDETFLVIGKISSNHYEILITSADSRIVRGLTGYVEEVIEELTGDSACLIFS